MTHSFRSLFKNFPLALFVASRYDAVTVVPLTSFFFSTLLLFNCLLACLFACRFVCLFVWLLFSGNKFHWRNYSFLKFIRKWNFCFCNMIYAWRSVCVWGEGGGGRRASDGMCVARIHRRICFCASNLNHGEYVNVTINVFWHFKKLHESLWRLSFVPKDSVMSKVAENDPHHKWYVILVDLSSDEWLQILLDFFFPRATDWMTPPHGTLLRPLLIVSVSIDVH